MRNFEVFFSFVLFFSFFFLAHIHDLFFNFFKSTYYTCEQKTICNLCSSEGRETREFRNSNTDAQRGGEYGERRGRGGMRGMSRGRGGPRGRGGYDNRGKREFDRQSGSDKT